MNEKHAIERDTAEAFLEHHNRDQATSFRIAEHGDTPDIVARDDAGDQLQLEIIMTEDRPGDIKASLCRSDARSLEALRRHVELVREDKADPLERVSSLTGNVAESLMRRLDAKMARRYGANTALVIRDTSGVDWDWDLLADQLKTTLAETANPFDRGIWILSRFKNRLFRLL